MGLTSRLSGLTTADCWPAPIAATADSATTVPITAKMILRLKISIPSCTRSTTIGAHFGRHSELAGRRYLTATGPLLVSSGRGRSNGYLAENKDWIKGYERGPS